MDNNQLFQSIFNKDIYANDAKFLLGEITEQHPYFAPAHFFLLQQTDKNDAAYNKQLAKTALLFNNSFLLNYQLRYKELDAATKDNIAENSTVKLEEAIINKVDSIINTLPLIPSSEDELINKENVIISKEVSVNDIVTPITSTEDEIIKTETAIISNEVPKIETLPTITSTEDEIINSINNTDKVEEEQEADTVPLKTMDFTIPPINTKEDILVFEPLYTTDYFASQGIKLSEEAKTTDKLGNQLKSFTEWLKSMKKIHPTDDTLQSNKIEDISIQNLAAKSNAENEVVTESMAEVFLHQGKINKAIDVYKKLSLQNPLKSAYFAAKIDNLKE